MKSHTKIDLEQLAKEIRIMKPRHKLYKLLQLELTLIGHWINRPRGNHPVRKGYKELDITNDT